jgi:hypothetical protein
MAQTLAQRMLALEGQMKHLEVAFVSLSRQLGFGSKTLALRRTGKRRGSCLLTAEQKAVI